MRQNAFNSHWKWMLPSGCLVIALSCCGIGVFVAILMAIPMAIKSSDVYQQAVLKAKNDERAKKALGTPIEEGWWATGNIRITGGGGDADLAIPISGPHGSGTLFAKARRDAGIWTFSTLEIAVANGGNRIDLLAKN